MTLGSFPPVPISRTSRATGSARPSRAGSSHAQRFSPWLCRRAPGDAGRHDRRALVSASAVVAQNARVEELVSAVVRVNAHINPEGRTVQGLGGEREGSGIVIDSAGLVLTIGYLMVEAYAAEVVDNNGRTVPADVVGYDHESGFGLLRAIEPLKLKPMALGKSAEIKEGDP